MSTILVKDSVNELPSDLLSLCEMLNPSFTMKKPFSFASSLILRKSSKLSIVPAIGNVMLAPSVVSE